MKTDKERMLEMVKSLDNPHENIKEFEREVNEENILKESDRMKALLDKKTNKDFKSENYYVTGRYQTGGRGQTVNTLVNDYQDASTTPNPKTQPSNLTAEEVLEVAIKRTLKSGQPINNIAFYDEINWNLMNLGFPAKNETDIKAAILSMVKE